MRREYDNSARVWIFGAAAFFLAVIVFFAGGKLLKRLSTPPAPRQGPAARPAVDDDGASLPSAAIRIKLKRIEPRKYRREGPSAPPAP